MMPSRWNVFLSSFDVHYMFSNSWNCLSSYHLRAVVNGARFGARSGCRSRTLNDDDDGWRVSLSFVILLNVDQFIHLWDDIVVSWLEWIFSWSPAREALEQVIFGESFCIMISSELFFLLLFLHFALLAELQLMTVVESRLLVLLPLIRLSFGRRRAFRISQRYIHFGVCCALLFVVNSLYFVISFFYFTSS